MKKFNTNILPIIGMSPGNGYFVQEVISALIQKVFKKYRSFVVVIPDIPAVSTYQALGYSFSRASKKASSRGRNLRNRTERALENQGIPSESFYVINWVKDVEENNNYKESLARIENLFTCNEKFRYEIRKATRLVLENSGKDILDIEKAINVGKQYILSEFAFLEICAELFGSKKTPFIYHKNWPVYEQYIAGKFDGIKRGHMTFEKIII